MGYQEAFLPFDHLADAAGIKKAIEECAHSCELPGFCVYYCAITRDFGGALFAHIGGDSSVVDQIARRYSYRCFSRSYDHEEHNRILDAALIESAARQRPDYARAAYSRMKQAFESILEKDRKTRLALKAETEELLPVIVKYLVSFGPSSLEAFAVLPVFKDHGMNAVFDGLERQGLIEFVETGYRDEIRLTDKACAEYGIASTKSFRTPEEKLLYVLSELGPLCTSHIAALLNMSVTKANKILKEQMESGRILKDTHIKPYMFRLVNTVDDELKAS